MGVRHKGGCSDAGRARDWPNRWRSLVAATNAQISVQLSTEALQARSSMTTVGTSLYCGTRLHRLPCGVLKSHFVELSQRPLNAIYSASLARGQRRCKLPCVARPSAATRPPRAPVAGTVFLSRARLAPAPGPGRAARRGRSNASRAGDSRRDKGGGAGAFSHAAPPGSNARGTRRPMAEKSVEELCEPVCRFLLPVPGRRTCGRPAGTRWCCS